MVFGGVIMKIDFSRESKMPKKVLIAKLVVLVFVYILFCTGFCLLLFYLYKIKSLFFFLVFILYLSFLDFILNYIIGLIFILKGVKK